MSSEFLTVFFVANFVKIPVIGDFAKIGSVQFLDARDFYFGNVTIVTLQKPVEINNQNSLFHKAPYHSSL